jgi:hypothetical protein
VYKAAREGSTQLATAPWRLARFQDPLAWRAILAGLCAVLLSGCGRSGSASAGTVARQYVRDVLRGDGTRVCSLLTPASRQATNAVLGVMDHPRFIQRSLGTTCAAYFKLVARTSLCPPTPS